MNRVQHPSQIPGYSTINARAAEVRSIAFQDVPESIGPFTVLPLTLRHYRLLWMLGSPFLPPFREPTGEELVVFLWLLSPDFAPDNHRGRRRHARACRCLLDSDLPWFKTDRALIKWNKKLKDAAAVRAPLVKLAREYMDEAMIDRPPAGGQVGPEFYCDEVSIIASMAREYGWSETAILDMPLKRIFQYQKEIREEFSWKVLKRKPVLWNPQDRIVDEYLSNINHPKNS